MRSACALIVAAACGHSSHTTTTASEQSFEAGVQTICDLPDHVPEAAQPEQRLAGAGKWLAEHVTNADTRKLGDLAGVSIDKEQLADAVQRAHLTRCKLLDNGMALQSYADAMKALCDAPTDNRVAYLRGHLLNPEVIRLVETIGTEAPAQAAKRLREATARAGIASCKVLASFE